MEQAPVSEILPGLYRSVLDAVADLEARGRRREAAELRSDAIAAYSRAWNEDAARRLRTLQSRAARLAEARRREGAQPALESLPRPVDLERTSPA